MTKPKENKVEYWLSLQNKRPWLWIIIFLLLTATQIDQFWWTLDIDVTGYISIARSVWSGEGLSCLGSKLLHFSPGYPILISPALLISSKPFLSISLINFAFVAVFTIGVYYWAKMYVPEIAIWLVGLSIINVSFWHYLRSMMSEPVFMATLIWTIIILNLGVRAEKRGKAIGWTLLGSLMLISLSTIRYSGIIVITGFALAIFDRVRRKQVSFTRAIGLTLLAGLPACAVVSALVLYDRSHLSAMESSWGYSYSNVIFSSQISLASQIFEGLRLRIAEVGRLLIPGMFSTFGRKGQWGNPSMIIYIPFAILIFIGWWQFLRRQAEKFRAEIFSLALPAYLLTYIVWPFNQGTRYLLPMLPLLWACFWMMLKRYRFNRSSILAVLLLFHLGVAGGYWLYKRGDAKRMHQHWPMIEDISEIAGKRNEILATYNIEWGLQKMIQMEMDRSIMDISDSPEINSGVMWIVTEEDDPAIAGFREYTEIGELKMLKREDY